MVLCGSVTLYPHVYIILSSFINIQHKNTIGIVNGLTYLETDFILSYLAPLPGAAMLCACCLVTDLHWRSVIHFIDAVSSGAATQDGGQDLQAYGEEVGPRGWCHTLKRYRSCVKLTLNWPNYLNRIPFAFCLQSDKLINNICKYSSI